MHKVFYSLLLIVTLQLTLSKNAHAYLDPGTGSYVIQVILAVVIGGACSIKMYWVKIKVFFGSRQTSTDKNSSDKLKP